MSAASRRKGVAGEREVAQAFERAGWTVRGLEGGGDLHVSKNGRTIQVEAKRYATRARWSEWRKQSEDEAGDMPRLLAARADKQPWVVPLADLLELIG